MTDRIKMTKERVLDYMDQEIAKYGSSRMDVKQIGDLADIVKDLAEAEYYCSVSAAMGSPDPSGYTRPRADRMQGMDAGRQGYGTMGHSDPVSAIRDMLMTASPEERARIRAELTGM